MTVPAHGLGHLKRVLVVLATVAARASARRPAFRHEAHNGPKHVFGYHMQVGGYDRATAIAQQLTDLRRVEPDAPVFITSDAGLDLSAIAAHFGAHYYYDPLNQQYDHSEFCNTSLPEPHKHCGASKGNITNGNYGNPIRYLGRIGDAMRACHCEFIVNLEDDVCVTRKPLSRPLGAVNGVSRPDWETVRGGEWFPPFVKFLELQGVSHAVRPAHGWLWGCAGGCAYSVSDLAHRPEFNFERSSAFWNIRNLRSIPFGGMLTHAVDMAGPVLAWGYGLSVIPWVEVFNCFEGGNIAIEKRKAGNIAFEHCCDPQKKLRGEGAANAAEPVRLVGAMAKPPQRPSHGDPMAENTRVVAGILSGTVVAARCSGRRLEQVGSPVSAETAWCLEAVEVQRVVIGISYGNLSLIGIRRWDDLDCDKLVREAARPAKPPEVGATHLAPREQRPSKLPPPIAVPSKMIPKVDGPSKIIPTVCVEWDLGGVTEVPVAELVSMGMELRYTPSREPHATHPDEHHAADPSSGDMAADATTLQTRPHVERSVQKHHDEVHDGSVERHHDKLQRGSVERSHDKVHATHIAPATGGSSAGEALVHAEDPSEAAAAPAVVVVLPGRAAPSGPTVLEQRLCACEPMWTHPTYLARPHAPGVAPPEPSDASCGRRVGDAARQAFAEIEHLTAKWNAGLPPCEMHKGRRIDPQPCPGTTPVKTLEAFQEAVLSRGNLDRVQAFMHKLRTCGEAGAVSVVVLGGSETAGAQCSSLRAETPHETAFLGLLPLNLSRPLVHGDSVCPWANRLRALLSHRYPRCGHIDVYNLAEGSTSTTWALGRVSTLFGSANSARGNRTIGEAADLVVVDYLNDGIIGDVRPWPFDDGTRSVAAVAEALEARTEYLMEALLWLPSRPAVVWFETGAGDQDFSPVPMHLEAAERHGVPVVSFRDVLGHPEDGRWETFTNGRAQVAATWPTGLFRNRSAPVEEAAAAGAARVPVVPRWPMQPGPPLRADTAAETGGVHPFLAWFGRGSHPHKGVHAAMAQVAYFFLQVAAPATVHPASCPGGVSAGVGGGPPEAAAAAAAAAVASGAFMPSPSALAKRKQLDPNAFCAKGPLSSYDARSLFGKAASGGPASAAQAVSLGGWRLVEDRPRKFGWVNDRVSGDARADTITFNVTLGADPVVAVEYMHTYDETAGAVAVSLTQEAAGPPGATGGEGGTAGAAHGRSAPPSSPGQPRLAPGRPVVVDSYVPSVRFALTTEAVLRPEGYRKGPAQLHLRLLSRHGESAVPSTPSLPFAPQRFKLVGLQSC